MNPGRYGTLALLSVALSCGEKRGPSPAAAPSPQATGGGEPSRAAATGPPDAAPPAISASPPGETSALWSLAPPGATFGLVVADGAVARGLELVERYRRRLEDEPFAARALAALDVWRRAQPFDLLAPAAYRGAGFEPTRGLAVFFGSDMSVPLLLVLPVSDVKAMLKTLDPEGTASVETHGGREVVRSRNGQATCTIAGGRFVCARTLDEIDAAVAPHASSIAAAVAALPPSARGDAELYIDVAKTPAAGAKLAALAQLGRFTAVGAALRVDLRRLRLTLWADGTMDALVASFLPSAPPASLANMSANATSIVRFRVDPRVLTASAPASDPVGGVDVRTDLLDQLTGDVQLVTAGRGLVAGAVLLEVKDPARVAKVVAAICAEARKQGELPVSALVAKAGSCTGEVSLSALADRVGGALPSVRLGLHVSGDLLAATVGELELASLRGSAVGDAGSPEAREALSGAHSLTLWTRGIGVDAASLPKVLSAPILERPEARDALAFINWWGGQVYELSFAASVTWTLARCDLSLTTSDADPEAPRAAQEVAVGRLLAGDRPGYLAGLAEIEKRYPGSLAARRAKLERVGTPTLGPVTGVIAGVGVGLYLLAARGMWDTGGGDPSPTPPSR